MILRVVIFLLLNFGALAIGGLFTGKGVASAWYAHLNKAPWTPPGWVFGFAWTTIMICFAFYMAAAWARVSNVKWLMLLYAVQLILNVLWNPTFFYYQHVLAAFIIIALLTALVSYMQIAYRSDLSWLSLLILPYFIWLVIATSLNGYILLKN